MIGKNIQSKIKRALEIPFPRLLKKVLGYKEIYVIGYRNTEKLLLENKNTSCIFTPIFEHVDNCWFADPILFLNNNVIYLFTEGFDLKSKKGSIYYSEFDKLTETFTLPKEIIAENYHMSFPMVFSWDESIYMIPETSDNYSINLYKATNFPYQWKKEHCFPVDIKIVDSVILNVSENEITLLGSEINDANPLISKFIYYKIKKKSDGYDLTFDDSENCNGEFSFSNRNAGNVIILHDERILPCQESTSIDYGKNLVFRNLNENDKVADVFSRNLLNEVTFENIDKRNYIGIHSYGCIDNLEVIDLRYLKH